MGRMKFTQLTSKWDEWDGCSWQGRWVSGMDELPEQTSGTDVVASGDEHDEPTQSFIFPPTWEKKDETQWHICYAFLALAYSERKL